MPLGLGIWEIVILLAILALLFGSKNLPSIARRLGSSVKELKDSVAEIDPRTMLSDEPKQPDAKRPPAEAAAPRSAPPADRRS